MLRYALLLQLALVCDAQDEFTTLLQQLSDDAPSVRQAACDKLLSEFPRYREKLQKMLNEVIDPEIVDRLKWVYRQGEKETIRRGFEAVLPDRIKRRFPRFADDLFSQDPERAALALMAVGRTTSLGPKDDPYAHLFMSLAECRRVLPHLSELLQPAYSSEEFRLAWIDLAAARTEILSEPALSLATRQLLRDPSKVVRDQAARQLSGWVAGKEELQELIARWEALDDPTRTQAINAAARLADRAFHPLLSRTLKEEKYAVATARAIARNRLDPLLDELKVEFLRNPKISVDAIIDLGNEALSIGLDRASNSEQDVWHLFKLATQLGATEHADRFAQWLSSENCRIHSICLACLSRIGRSAQAEAVDRFIRNHAQTGSCIEIGIQVLAKWEARDQICGLLDLFDKDQIGRFIVMPVLALRPPRAGKKLTEYLQGEPKIAVQALTLLGSLGNQEAARSQIESIRKLLAAIDDYHLRREVTTAIGSLGLTEFREPFEQLAADSDREADIVQWGLARLWTLEDKKRCLRDGNPRLQRIVLRTLQRGDCDSLLDELKELAGSENKSVRCEFWRSTERFPVRVAHAVLPRFLKSDYPDPFLQSVAPSDAVMLETLKSKNSHARRAVIQYDCEEILDEHPELIDSLLQDPDLGVRLRTICEMPGQRRDRWVFDTIREVLTKSTDTFEISSIVSVLDPSDVPQVRNELTELAERIVKEPDKFGARTDFYISGNGGWRMGGHWLMERLAEELSTWKLVDAEPILLRFSSCTEPRVRLASAKALQKIGSTKAEPLARELFLSSVPEADQAGEILTALGIPMTAFLSSPQPSIRLRALKEIGRSKDTSAFRAVVSLYESSDCERVREFATEAAGRIARPEHARQILDLAYTPNPEARTRWLLHLLNLPCHEFLDEIATFLDDAASWLALRILCAQVSDSRQAMRILAWDEARGAWASEPVIQMIHRLKLKEALSFLSKGLDRSFDDVYTFQLQSQIECLAELGAHELLPKVIARIDRISPGDRARLIPAVARLGGEDTIPYLVESMKSRNFDLRLASAQALAGLGAEKHRSAIENILRQAHPSWQTCRAMMCLGLTDAVRLQLGRSTSRGGDLPLLCIGARLGIAETYEVLLRKLKCRRPIAEPAARALELAWDDQRLGALSPYSVTLDPFGSTEEFEKSRQYWIEFLSRQK